MRLAKLTSVGKDDALVTFTSRDDIVRFLVHLPASKLEWTKFNLEGERAVSATDLSPLIYR